MRKAFGHFRRYIFRGFFAIIPFALSFFAVRLLYVSIDQRVQQWVQETVGFTFPGFGILLVLLILYVFGVATSFVIWKKVLQLVEMTTDRIPLIKTIYQIGKQLANAFTLSEQQIFKRVVLVEFLRAGIWTIGFVTGTVVDRQQNNVVLLKVYVPTPPNPTSGYMLLVRESDTRNPGWSIDEAMKAIISGGIIGPEEIRA